MKRFMLKFCSIALSMLFVFGLMAGCTKNKQSLVEQTNKKESTLKTTDANKTVYPLNTNVTLKYWMELPVNTAFIVKNFSETNMSKELEKRTGIKVEYLHPAAGQAKEAFNLLLASGELPDIIEYNWHNMPGGPSKAISDGFILKLNEAFDKYAPNLTKYIKANPDIDRMIRTDDGSYYVFPFIRGDNSLMVSQGPIVRKDWLDDLGIKEPETIDEWYPILKAFKDKKNATAPLSTNLSGLNLFFSGGFNAYFSMYNDNGKVKYGPLEPGRKEFFTTMNKWFTEGLLDRNFATLDNKTIDANILGGKTGATQGAGGSGIGRWLPAGIDKDPKFNLVGVSYPSPKKGEISRFGSKSLPYSGGSSSVISAKSKNVEIAARFLDYAYSDEGGMLNNFGIEGVSYKMVNNYPTYTDVIMKNPQGLSPAQSMSNYLKAAIGGPFIQDKIFLEQYYSLPQQKEAVIKWIKCDQGKYNMPPITPTVEESTELAKLVNDLNTYVDEMSLKFIMGAEPLTNYDKFIAQINKLSIDKIISLYQNALDRFVKRK